MHTGNKDPNDKAQANIATIVTLILGILIVVSGLIPVFAEKTKIGFLGIVIPLLSAAQVVCVFYIQRKSNAREKKHYDDTKKIANDNSEIAEHVRKHANWKTIEDAIKNTKKQLRKRKDIEQIKQFLDSQYQQISGLISLCGAKTVPQYAMEDISSHIFAKISKITLQLEEYIKSISEKTMTELNGSIEKFLEYVGKAEQEKPDAEAQCNLGNCYLKGNGVDKDPSKAVEWYSKAAEKGYAKAQYNLGCCYAKGEGIDKDQIKAVEWYIKAAMQEHANAQCSLGVCYFNGEGVDKDPSEAVEWYSKAAKQEFALAQYALGQLYYYGSIGLVKNREKAIEWLERAGKNDHPDALLLLGRCYTENADSHDDLRYTYKEPEYTKAFNAWKRAAELGNSAAQYNVGECYEQGKGVELDIVQAKYWYECAAKQEYANAGCALKRLSET